MCFLLMNNKSLEILAYIESKGWHIKYVLTYLLLMFKQFPLNLKHIDIVTIMPFKTQSLSVLKE